MYFSLQESTLITAVHTSRPGTVPGFTKCTLVDPGLYRVYTNIVPRYLRKYPGHSIMADRFLFKKKSMIWSQFNLTVSVDNTPPTITPLNDITRTIPIGTGGTTVSWTEPTATDDSGTATLQQRTNAPGSFFPVGTTQVTYTFGDPSGNTASISFNVNVIEGKLQCWSLVSDFILSIKFSITKHKMFQRAVGVLVQCVRGSIPTTESHSMSTWSKVSLQSWLLVSDFILSIKFSITKHKMFQRACGVLVDHLALQ